MFSIFKRRSTDHGWLAWPTASTLGSRRALLLTPRQFEREVARERVRSTRRGIPFCVLQVELVAASALDPEAELSAQTNESPVGVLGRTRRMTQLKKQSRKLVDVLHHNLRMTDEKGVLSATRYGVLLVDTPEMGGRAVLDRMTTLTADAGLGVRLSLQVHDPEGFGDRVDEPSQPFGEPRSQRDGDPDDENWRQTPSPMLCDSGATIQASVAVDRSVCKPQASRDQVFNESRRGRSSGARALQNQQSQITVVDEELTLPASSLSRLTKRTIDVVGATIGLISTGPFVLASMAAIRWSDGGPVFFCQTREGQFGRPFTIYKLRTMVVDAEKSQAALRSASHRDGPAFKIRRDPRVTRVGRLLRATCLDELPQLMNVLKGDMSLVGPRPLPWHESRACERWHRRRLDVRPGLTCIWQINKAKAETFDDWMRMDLQYIDQSSLLQDLRLIARTVVVPMTGRGGD
ncbi:Sugar transferase involved in LPS biosynthesis (colanic, teichoic acid) [Neorhodopirellula lusitana]|uniref:Sugar transferase involved in LPS biosynthesis (Colanic, teichoic acid) n=1 Tax=Neorhodopirellula lusitana TaxID=445327 RepID=A0ABY1PZE2_9BACT|nr:sugar transferase [Neorhodopirellula lusitana]SMP51639.1 Sugar transferase involved in LPS biosynthesis (colanic, teichoic acid) [Neorhodopirellula lusitana]